MPRGNRTETDHATTVRSCDPVRPVEFHVTRQGNAAHTVRILLHRKSPTRCWWEAI
jgi:hypothetical protein